MITAADVEHGAEWKEYTGRFDPEGIEPIYTYGIIEKIFIWDAIGHWITLYEDPEETIVKETRWIEGHQKYIIFGIKQPSGHIITRSFWSTDVVEEFTDGKKHEESASAH